MVLLLCSLTFVGAAVAMRWIHAGELANWLPHTVFCLFLATSLLLRARWALHLLFGVAIYVAITWISMLAAVLLDHWPEPELLNSILSLIPGVMWVGFWLAMYAVVRTQQSRLS